MWVFTFINAEIHIATTCCPKESLVEKSQSTFDYLEDYKKKSSSNFLTHDHLQMIWYLPITQIKIFFLLFSDNLGEDP